MFLRQSFLSPLSTKYNQLSRALAAASAPSTTRFSIFSPRRRAAYRRTSPTSPRARTVTSLDLPDAGCRDDPFLTSSFASSWACFFHRVSADVPHCCVVLHSLHLFEIRSDLVDPFPDPFPNRGADELTSGAVPNNAPRLPSVCVCIEDAPCMLTCHRSPKKVMLCQCHVLV